MKLQCNFHQWNWGYGQVLYTCFVNNSVLTEKRLEIFEIEGQHIENKTNKDVHAIHFSNTSTVSYLPKGLTILFPNLKAIMLRQTGLKGISRDDLVGLENLQALLIQDNNISSLPDDLFKGMEKLVRISLRNNKIVQVSSKLLQPILNNGLTFVSFLENPGINAIYHPDSQEKRNSGCESLKKLMEIMDGTMKQQSIQGGEAEASDPESFMNKILQSTDFVLVANDSKEFRVHKRVIAYASPYFSRLFQSNMELKFLNIPEFSSNVIESFLIFIYTGNIQNVQPDFIELATIATKLEVSYLRTICERTLLKKMDPSNTYELFALSSRLEMITLRQATFDEICKLFPDEILDENLINDTAGVKELVEARSMGKRKIEMVEQEVAQELEAVLKKCRQK